MADANAALQALTAFATQSAADLAAAKTNTLARTADLAAAVKAEADAAAQALTARLTLDALNGVTEVEAAITKVERDPAFKWYVAGAGVVVVGTIVIVLAKAVGAL